MFIHYGTALFERAKMKPLSNGRFITKPRGGFWAFSEENAIMAAYSMSLDTEHEVHFTVKDSANILEIDHTNIKQMIEVMFNGDWSNVAKYYDAIRYTGAGVENFGIDSECICVINPNIIKEVS